jgi:hypothetical protein
VTPRPSISDMSNALGELLVAERPFAPPLGRAVMVTCLFVLVAAAWIAGTSLWAGISGGSTSPGPAALQTPTPPTPRGIDLDAPIAPSTDPKPLPSRR